MSNPHYQLLGALIMSYGVLIGLVATTSCPQRPEPEICRDFFSQSRSEKEFDALALEEQFEIHRCEIMHMPGTGAFAIQISKKYGSRAVPFLLDRLSRDKKRGSNEHDVTTLAVAYLLESLLITGELKKDSKVVEIVEMHVREMESGGMKREADKLLAFPHSNER